MGITHVIPGRKDTGNSMGKRLTTVEEISLGDALCVLTAEQVLGMLPDAENPFNKAGVVLVNERFKGNVKDTDGNIIEVTASLYVQRAPIGDDERAEVAKVAGDRQESADKKKRDESDKLAREKREAFKLGQESQLDSIRNIAVLNAAVAGIRSKL